MNTLVFGDIHGCAAAAERGTLLAEELACRAIFLGDYVDRGPSSLETLRLLIRAKYAHPDWIFLRGNHDQMLLDLLHGKANLRDQEVALNRYLFSYNDCATTLHELNHINDLEYAEIIRFLETTSGYYEDEAFIYCHAILRDTNEPIEGKSLQELIWNYDYKPTWKGKPFIHGHLPCDQLTFKSKGININTKCGYGGALTGLYFNTTDANSYKTYSIQEHGALE
jgi:serine/threonine protein phosphatase 1